MERSGGLHNAIWTDEAGNYRVALGKFPTVLDSTHVLGDHRGRSGRRGHRKTATNRRQEKRKCETGAERGPYNILSNMQGGTRRYLQMGNLNAACLYGQQNGLRIWTSDIDTSMGKNAISTTQVWKYWSTRGWWTLERKWLSPICANETCDGDIQSHTRERTAQLGTLATLGPHAHPVQ